MTQKNDYIFILVVMAITMKLRSSIGDQTVKYYTHYNYSRPFLVSITGCNVCVSPNDEDDEENELESLYYTPDTIFIGNSLQTVMTISSGGFGNQFNGNSFLFEWKVDEKVFKYVYVGQHVFTFYTDDKIIKYISPVGNNDVPYPVAISAKYIYGLVHPNGYFEKTEIGIDANHDVDVDYIFKQLLKYSPFAKPFVTTPGLTSNTDDGKSGKSEQMSLQQFNEIMNQSIYIASKTTLDTLCEMFKVSKNGTRLELIARLEQLRRLEFIH